MYLESCIALQERLLNLNVLNIVFLLLLGSLRNLNLQDTVTDLSGNLLLISILWQSVTLRVAAVRELTTQVMLFLLLLLLLILVLDGYIQIAILIDVHLDHIFLQTRSCNLHRISCSTFLDVDCRSCCVHVWQVGASYVPTRFVDLE